MGDRVDREMALSRIGADVETQAARQAHYIKWASLFEIGDPCGAEKGYQRILAIYIKYVMLGINCRNKAHVRSDTVKGYAMAVNTLFSLRDFPLPADFEDPFNMTAILVHNLAREENIARQRSPLDNGIFAFLQQQSAKSSSKDSVDSVLFNAVALGRITGFRLGEFAQNKQSTVDYHTYPSGTKVVKAMTSNDFVFFDSKGRKLKKFDQDDFEAVSSMKITWRIQKNRQNGQSLKIAADKTNPLICPVRNAMQLVERARRLDQSSDLPLCLYKNKDGKSVYLTGSKIAELFRKAAKAVHPDLLPEDISKYSAHSIRVWACVLLDEAGKSPDFIKKRLRWMGDSFRMYLRDTPIINRQHRDALQSASAETMEMIATMVLPSIDAGNPLDSFEADNDDLPDLLPEDSAMGDLVEDMD